jgi:hypothetical protein
MKKEYARYIKSKLKELIPKEFPCFKFSEGMEDIGLDYNFICKDGRNINMISIQNSHDENAFMIELFWSNDGSKFQNDLTYFWFDGDENILEEICSKSENSIRIGLPIFYSRDLESWWAIDPTGKIVESIKKNGFITSDAYSRFYAEDTFFSDENQISKNEYEKYIDPLINNAVELIKRYAVPLFKCLNNK